jgi:CheY-like chemotaxis protein
VPCESNVEKVGHVCILLVEDEPLIREIMVECLQDAGLDVMEAATGDEAIEFIRARSRHFSILVTDFHMPGRTDGSTVASCIRWHLPQIPVVIASGRPEVFRAQWKTELGYTLLRKPYRPYDLVQLVHELVP